MSARYRGKKKWRLAAGVLAAALAAGAEAPAATEVTGPAIGYVFDGAAAGVRQVIGMPGAALLTAPVSLESPLAGAVSMWSDHALVLSKGDRLVRLLEVTQRLARVRAIAGLPAGADEVALSPGGRAASLLYREAAKVVVLTGLPGAPQVAREVVIAKAPLNLAVSDDGSLLAVSYDNAVLLSSAAGGTRWLLTLGRPAALAVSHSGADLLLADAQYHAVYWIKDVNGAVSVVRLAGEREGIATPVGAAFSPDDRRALVANAGTDTLTAIDLATGVISPLATRVKPAGLYPVGPNTYSFRAPAPDEPLWLYEAGGARPRVFFAPPEMTASPAIPLGGGQ